MARQGMKKEGAVGLILIAVIIVVAVLGFRPKGLESALGSGFTPADVTKIGVVLVPASGDQISTEVLSTDEEFPKLLAVLQEPSYSRTSAKDDQITLDYQVYISFADDEAWAWRYQFQGGKLIQAGPSDKLKTYQISGGQATQQEILDYCLTLVEED